MKKIYVFPQTGPSIHGFIMRQFGRVQPPSLIINRNFYVLSEYPPVEENELLLSYDVIDEEPKQDMIINLKTLVAFFNTQGHHMKRVYSYDGPILIPARMPRMSRQQVIEKFCWMTGLRPTQRLDHIKKQRDIELYNLAIRNRWYLEGEFKVENSSLFTKALYEGIGSKRSYGHGLLLISRDKEE